MKCWLLLPAFPRISSETGSIEPGKRVDLVLLNANPLKDTKNTRNIAGVVVNGK